MHFEFPSRLKQGVSTVICKNNFSFERFPPRMRAGWKFLTVHPDIHYAAQSGAQTASNSCKGSEHNETKYKYQGCSRLPKNKFISLSENAAAQRTRQLSVYLPKKLQYGINKLSPFLSCFEIKLKIKQLLQARCRDLLSDLFPICSASL